MTVAINPPKKKKKAFLFDYAFLSSSEFGEHWLEAQNEKQWLSERQMSPVLRFKIQSEKTSILQQILHINFFFKLYYTCKYGCYLEKSTWRGQGMVSQWPLTNALQNVLGANRTAVWPLLYVSYLREETVLETENRNKIKSHKPELKQPFKPCLDSAATQDRFSTGNFPGFSMSTFCYKWIKQ